MTAVCNCDPEIEVPCEHDRRHAEPPGPRCSVCGLSGHTGAEQHCSVCRVHPAEHKIGEEGSGDPTLHNLTNYLCCAHFSRIVGDCGRLPTFAHRDHR